MSRRLSWFAFLFVVILFLGAVELRSQTDIAKLYRIAPTTYQPVDTSFSPRRLLSLNGVWQATSDNPQVNTAFKIPGAFLFEGSVHFERTFRLDSTMLNKAVRLYVTSCNNTAQIKLNGEITGSHEGGYMPFVVEFRNERLYYAQDNKLEIIVDNRLSPLSSLPAKQRPFGWTNEGGLLREVFLEILPEVRLALPLFTYRLQAGLAQINFTAQLRHRRGLAPEALAKLTCTLEIWDVLRRQKLASSTPLACENWNGDRQDLALACQLTEPALWAPSEPNLYALRAVLMQGNSVIDELWQETGFRSIQIAGQELLLNGAPLELRGANWMEAYNRQSVLLDSTELVELVTTAQQLGLNALRVIGRPPHPLLPSLCDRAGIFLLQELPLYYLTDAHFNQPNFSPLAQAQAQEMIERDQHHPSVLAWGLGAMSAPLSLKAQNTLEELVAEIRKRDDRPVYAVTLPGWMSLWEPHADFLLIDWFLRTDIVPFRELAKNSAKPVMPIIGQWASEALVRAGEPNSEAERVEAEGVQAEYYMRVFSIFDRAEGQSNYFLHALKDWEGPAPMLAVGPLALAETSAQTDASAFDARFASSSTRRYPCGLIDVSGQNRLAFKVVQAHNRRDTNPVGATKHTLPGNSGIFQIVGILLIVLLLYFIQRDRRLQDNLRRIFVHPHGFYIDLYENRKVAPFLTTLLGLAESCILALLLTQFFYAFRHDVVFDHVINLVLSAPYWKAVLIWLVWNPAWFLAGATLAIFLLGVLSAIFLRILGMFFSSSLTISQYLTFVFWVGANLLILGAIAPIFHRLLLMTDFVRPTLFFVAVIFLWLIGRFFRAIRVLYMISFLRAAIICIVIFGGLVASIILYYDQSQAIFDYAKYYFEMLKARA